MRKNKRLWSFALAGALAVSNLSAVAMPLSGIIAHAAPAAIVVSGNTEIGDTVTFSAGTTGATLKDTFANPVTIVSSVRESGEVELDNTLPDNDTSTFTAAVSGVGAGTGYEFRWFDGTNYLVPAANEYQDITAGSTNAKLTAVKLGKTITINTKEGTSLLGTYTKQFGTNLATSIPDEKKDYYEFTGWSLTSSSATSADIVAGASAATQSSKFDALFEAGGFDTDSDINIFSLFKENEYTIKYNIDNADVGNVPGNTTWKETARTDLAASTGISKTNYSFVEWNTKKDGSGKGYAAASAGKAVIDDLAEGVKEITLYAIFDNSTTYTATLDNSANLFAAVSNEVWGGNVDSASASISSKVGKVTLPTVVDTIMNTKNQIKIDSAVLGGNNFLGWDDEQDGSTGYGKTAKYRAGQEVSITKTTTFFPVIEEVATHATINFTASNATGTMKSVTDAYVGDKYTLPNSSFVANEKYHFDHWTVGGAGTYKPGDEVTLTATTSCNAVYVEDTFTVTYRKSDSTLIGTTVYKAITDNAANFPAGPTGLTNFLGWDTNKSSVSPEFTVSDNIVESLYTTEGAQVTLYAIAPETLVTITYNESGTTEGTFDTSEAPKVAANNSFKLLSTAANAPAGMELYGWTTRKFVSKAVAIQQLGEDGILKPGASYNAGNKAISFYAVYQAEAGEITYDATGNDGYYVGAATTGTMDKTKSYTSTATLAKCTLEKTGYEFIGWDNVQGTTGAGGHVPEVIYEDGESNVAVNQTLYPVFKENTYRIKFDANNEAVTGTVPSQVVSGSDMTTTNLSNSTGLTVPASLTFIGWDLEPKSTTPKYKAADLGGTIKCAAVIKDSGVAANDDVTLYAIYEVDPTLQEAKDAQAQAEEEAAAAKEEADAAKEEAKESAAEADAANAAAEQANKEKEAAETKAGIAEAAAEKANEDKDAAQKEAADAKADADAQKAAADKANADADAAKKDADAAKAELAKVPKAQENVVAETGEKVDTFADGTAVLKEIPAEAIKNGSYTVPESVKVNGADVKVTKVASKAFYKNKKVKKITFGANIEEIGGSACNGASKLKVVRIKGKDVIIRRNAFKKINKKAKIIVADKETKKNVETKGGQPKTVKVKKGK